MESKSPLKIYKNWESRKTAHLNLDEKISFRTSSRMSLANIVLALPFFFIFPLLGVNPAWVLLSLILSLAALASNNAGYLRLGRYLVAFSPALVIIFFSLVISAPEQRSFTTARLLLVGAASFPVMMLLHSEKPLCIAVILVMGTIGALLPQIAAAFPWKFLNSLGDYRLLDATAAFEAILLIGGSFYYFRRESLKRQFEIEALMNSQRKLMSLVAHDLRSPLISYLHFVDILTQSEGDLTPDEEKELTSYLKNSASSMLHLIENLLEWARGTNGYGEPQRSWINIRHLIEESTAYFDLTLKKKSITIHTPQVTEALCFADPQLIGIVLRNILSNAIKFSFPGEPIHWEVEPIRQGWRVGIRDLGVGVPEHLLEILNKTPGQVRREGTEGERGTGLGLWLTRDLLKAHDSRLEVVSNRPRGLYVYFDLLNEYPG